MRRICERLFYSQASNRYIDLAVENRLETQASPYNNEAGWLARDSGGVWGDGRGRGSRAQSSIPFLIALTIGLAGAAAFAQQSSRTVLDGVYTEAQAERGRAVYAGQCYECHGHDLEGKYESSPLAGDEFIANWVGQDLRKLSDRIRITMSGDAPGTMGGPIPPPLTREQTADLVAFLLWFNKYPAGKTDLTTRPEILEQIQFVTPKAP